MNFHPIILNNAALMDRPRSLKDLDRMVGLVEERLAVARERGRFDKPGRLSNKVGGPSKGGVRNTAGRSTTSAGGTCWSCGQLGHLARACPQRQGPSENGQAPGGQAGPRADVLAGLKRVSGGSRDLPFG
jgi:hypothetical protein